MTRTGVVKSMKDFYWDIRPKPEYGTIEIRVFDTPLTIERAAAGRLRAGAGRLVLAEQPFMPTEDDYLVYTYNRFQACRFGLDAVYVDPATGSICCCEHILQTLDHIARHAGAHGASARCMCCAAKRRPARTTRAGCANAAREQLLAEVSRQAALRFRGQHG
jgi:carboxylate-amine ligase